MNSVEEKDDEGNERELEKAVADTPGNGDHGFCEGVRGLFNKGSHLFGVNAVLKGVRDALTEVGDGKKPVWKRHPRVNPVAHPVDDVRNLTRKDHAHQRQRNQDRDDDEKHHHA